MFIIACKKKREKANNFIKQSSLTPILARLEISKPVVYPFPQQPLHDWAMPASTPESVPKRNYLFIFLGFWNFFFVENASRQKKIILENGTDNNTSLGFQTLQTFSVNFQDVSELTGYWWYLKLSTVTVANLSFEVLP